MVAVWPRGGWVGNPEIVGIVTLGNRGWDLSAFIERTNFGEPRNNCYDCCVTNP